MDAEAKRTVLRLFRYGLFGLATGTLEAPVAMTVNWVTQASFEPPLLCVALENDSQTSRVVQELGTFTLSVFEESQRELAGQLGRRSSKVPTKLDGVVFASTPAGLVALAESLGYLECRVSGQVPAGDHLVVVAEITDAVVLRDGAPLSMSAAGFRYFG
jgi:flavin reductase (DIM6/NTAB) family NADH-FMN oxidoreductase RutF